MNDDNYKKAGELKWRIRQLNECKRRISGGIFNADSYLGDLFKIESEPFAQILQQDINNSVTSSLTSIDEEITKAQKEFDDL